MICRKQTTCINVKYFMVERKMKILVNAIIVPLLATLVCFVICFGFMRAHKKGTMSIFFSYPPSNHLFLIFFACNGNNLTMGVLYYGPYGIFNKSKVSSFLRLSLWPRTGFLRGPFSSRWSAAGTWFLGASIWKR